MEGKEGELLSNLNNLLADIKIGKTDCEVLKEQLENANDDNLVQIFESIAGAAKESDFRKLFTTKDFLLKLLNVLSDKIKNITKLPIIIPAIRSIANILFSNESARTILYDFDGGLTLINLFDHFNTEIVDYASNAIQESSNDLCAFANVRAGLVCNYLLSDSEEVCKKAVDLKIVDKVQNFVKMCIDKNQEKTERIVTSTLSVLNVLTEQLADLYFEADLNILISKILKDSTDRELTETCLELLHYQAENDNVKFILAKSGLCESIYKLLEQHKSLADETIEMRNLMKMSLDLVILILTGDDAMNFLYKNSDLLILIESWLDCEEPDIDILTSNVLAVGNFARNDIHCISMVERNILKKLALILKRNNGIDADMKLQHALLSTLKNLIIPKANKPLVVDVGILDVMLNMLEIHQPPVVFKLLGTLRMAVDKQDKLAVTLLQNKKLLKHLVAYSTKSDCAISSESSRLIAWLLKNAFQLSSASELNARDILNGFIEMDGTVEIIIKMLSSNHLVMQNEAIIALTILSCAYYQSQEKFELDEKFLKYDLSKNLVDFLKKNCETMTKEIADNVQTLVKYLRNSECMKNDLETKGISDALKMIPSYTNYCTL